MAVHFVTLFALLLVQGLLEFILGSSLVCASLSAGFLKQSGQEPPFLNEGTVRYTYLILGAVCIAAGITRVWAGIDVLRRKRRVFILMATAFGLVTCFTCQCAPSSLLVASYAFAILHTKEGKREFLISQNGAEKVGPEKVTATKMGEAEIGANP